MTLSEVKQQYERFPYPPVNALALPRAGQGARIAYAHGAALAGKGGVSHRGIRILVVGCGTLEPVVVGQVHPQAAEIVALDFSRAALARLRRRLFLARARDRLYLRRLYGRALPPVRQVHADLLQWQDEPFDYIIASNVLHHLADPAAGLAHLASLLKPGGIMRVMTYACRSRLWIRETRRWLACNRVSAESDHPARRARALIAQLPPQHPIRRCFVSHPESRSETGIVDAFLHACERPLSPLAWRAAAQRAGLQLLGESQRRDACSGWLDRLCREPLALDPWQKLQVLDDLLLLGTSPILWLTRSPASQRAAAVPDMVGITETAPQRLPDIDGGRRLTLPSSAWWSMGQGVRSADALLAGAGVTVEQVLHNAQQAHGEVLLADYNLGQLRDSAAPWDERTWQALAARYPRARLHYHGSAVNGDTLAQQADWLLCRYGALQPWVACTLR